MSTWMSIGFDPDQMDPVTASDTQAAISGAVTPAELGVASEVKATKKHRMASALKHLIPRRTSPVPSS